MIDLAIVNAVFILFAVWKLSGGDTHSGNWLNIVATVSGAAVTTLAELWPLVIVNVILFWRSAYILGRRAPHTRGQDNG